MREIRLSNCSFFQFGQLRPFGAAFDEATRAELPVCGACLSRWLARRMVLEVLPVLHANYRHECALTLEQVQTLVKDAGRAAAHGMTLAHRRINDKANRNKRL